MTKYFGVRLLIKVFHIFLMLKVFGCRKDLRVLCSGGDPRLLVTITSEALIDRIWQPEPFCSRQTADVCTVCICIHEHGLSLWADFSSDSDQMKMFASCQSTRLVESTSRWGTLPGSNPPRDAACWWFSPVLISWSDVILNIFPQ